MKNNFTQWKNDYGLEFEPNYSKETELDCMAAFKAGQQSKQAEVDDLQKKYDAMYNAFVVADDYRKEWHRCYVGIRQREDELQKKIDDAINCLEQNKPSLKMEYKHAINALSILKGEETK